MKALETAFILFLFVLLSIFPVGASGVRVGVVNLDKVYRSYKKVKADRKALQRERKEREKELKRKEKELKRLKDMYERSDLGEKEKLSLRKKISKKQKEIDMFIKESNSYLVHKAKVLSQKRTEEIKKAIRDCAKKKRLDIVIDSGCTHYFRGTVDITDDVIKVLNARSSEEEGEDSYLFPH